MDRRPEEQLANILQNAYDSMTTSDLNLSLDYNKWFSSFMLIGDLQCPNGWFYNQNTNLNIINVHLIKFDNNSTNDSYGQIIATNTGQYTGADNEHIFKFQTVLAIVSNPNYLLHKNNHYCVEPYIESTEEIERFHEAVNDLTNQMYNILLLYHRHKYPTYDNTSQAMEY